MLFSSLHLGSKVISAGCTRIKTPARPFGESRTLACVGAEHLWATAAPPSRRCSAYREVRRRRGLPRALPLKTPKQPAKLRRVAFLGGSAPSRPKSRPDGRLASKRFAAARSKDTTFSRLTARKCCCHPRRGRAAEGIRPAALLWDMCLHRTQKNMDDTRRLDCRPGEEKSRGFPGFFCGSSVKAHDQ